MEGLIILALVLAMPIVLLPVAFVWYLNGSAIFSAVRALKERRIARDNRIKVEEEVQS